MSIFRIFGEVYVLLSLLYNTVTSRSSSFPYKSIEFFVNLLDVGYNGPQKHKYIFLNYLNLIRSTYKSQGCTH
jgi:hypothetical protein